jgi:hypothetical protein
MEVVFIFLNLSTEGGSGCNRRVCPQCGTKVKFIHSLPCTSFQPARRGSEFDNCQERSLVVGPVGTTGEDRRSTQWADFLRRDIGEGQCCANNRSR